MADSHREDAAGREPIKTIIGKNLLAKAHKNPDFVLGKPENGGANGKSAQKPRFCARNGRKWGFRRVKAHKNPDFVLGKPENGGPEGQKRTKTSILCSE